MGSCISFEFFLGFGFALFWDAALCNLPRLSRRLSSHGLLFRVQPFSGLVLLFPFGMRPCALCRSGQTSYLWQRLCFLNYWDAAGRRRRWCCVNCYYFGKRPCAVCRDGCAGCTPMGSNFSYKLWLLLRKCVRCLRDISCVW